ncbi:MAG: phenylalanine--tRNA ligase subunit beta [Planctomycetes bacterium]|nr:phenylalanine--tRNA ligase subunit beta [Planctomycetota bacterium]
MKVPQSWLRDYVDLGSPAEVAKTLVFAGVGIEGADGGVLDLELTANRADLLSMLGIARELALLTGKPVREPKVEFAEAEPWPVPVAVEDESLCPRYVARIVTGVTVGPSPAWMQEKLDAAGLRPVNNIVDITNFVLLECGQPLHAFDLELLRGPAIVVRRGRGEKMVAIDGKECTLDSEMLVIADSERAVAVAGVMGGKESEIHGGTKDVLIESAQFDPVSVRRTSRRLGLSSESSYRFERGVDWETIEWASRRAAQLMAELAGGKVRRGSVDVVVSPPERRVIRFRLDRVNAVLGTSISNERIYQILGKLGCVGPFISGVRPPARRRDIRSEVDLIEEIARVDGYDKIPSDTDLGTRVASDRPDDLVRDAVRSALTGMGCFEVLTWSFSDVKDDRWAPGDPVALRDPAGNVDRRLRKSLAPGLLDVLKTNENYKEPLVPIFEIVKVYFETPDGFGEREVLGIATPEGYAHLKGLVERVLERVGLCPGDVTAHLSESGAAELDFEEICRKARLDRKFRDFSRTPPVGRDLAVVLDESVTWARLEACVRAAAPPALESIGFLDVYRGKPVPPGKKSVAFSMTFRAPDRTLTGDEADAAVKGIVDAIAVNLGGTLRQ